MRNPLWQASVMRDNLEALSGFLAGETGRDRESWKAALKEGEKYYGRAGMLEADSIKWVARAAGSPARFLKILTLLAEMPRKHPQEASPLEFLKLESEPFPYRQEAWIAAILLVSEWAENKGNPCDIRQYIQFIGCCAEFGSRQDIRQDLTALTQDMLDDFGFEGDG